MYSGLCLGGPMAGKQMAQSTRRVEYLRSPVLPRITEQGDTTPPAEVPTMYAGDYVFTAIVGTASDEGLWLWTEDFPNHYGSAVDYARAVELIVQVYTEQAHRMRGLEK